MTVSIRFAPGPTGRVAVLMTWRAACLREAEALLWRRQAAGDSFWQNLKFSGTAAHGPPFSFAV